MAKIKWDSKQETKELDKALKDVFHFTIILLYMASSDQFLKDRRESLYHAIKYFVANKKLKATKGKKLYRYTVLSNTKYARLITDGRIILDKFFCYSFSAHAAVTEKFYQRQMDYSGIDFSTKDNGYYLHDFVTDNVHDILEKVESLVNANNRKAVPYDYFSGADRTVKAVLNTLKIVKENFNTKLTGKISVKEPFEYFGYTEQEYIVLRPLSVKVSDVDSFMPHEKVTDLMLRKPEVMKKLLDYATLKNPKAALEFLYELSKKHKLYFAPSAKWHSLAPNHVYLDCFIGKMRLSIQGFPNNDTLSLTIHKQNESETEIEKIKLLGGKYGLKVTRK